MIEVIRFIGQDEDHFLGTLIFMGVLGWVMSKIILACRGIDKD